MSRIALFVLIAAPLLARDAYLFTSFRRNGETGVFFAISRDGKRWTSLNNGEPWIKPELPGMLMRDPWLGRGKDGTWHLLWTGGWREKAGKGEVYIGYSSSRDLIDWEPQREIVVMQNEPKSRNAWAPEAVWDKKRKEWIVFWSTTIPGRFPDTDATGDDGFNHRLYAMTTSDFRTFSMPRLWYDPGFNSIDATVVRDRGRWIMIFKDERLNPLQKRLRFSFADSPAGPWSGPTEPFTRDWVEGPSAVKVGRDWIIYYDHYAKPQHYGAVRTRDWRKFEDITEQISFPPDHRHGTVVRINGRLARELEQERR